MTVLLGTVAIEPNRWATVDPSWCATIDVADWLPGIAEAGFDGIELWEKHLTAAVVAGPLPVTVFNTYVSFDDANPADRGQVAARVAQAGSSAVKFNVGRDPGSVTAYAERIAAWLERLPTGVRALCECHERISIAQDPATAAAIFAAAGPPARVQAIVHTHEDPDHIRARFDAYGDRIGHVHVNHFDRATASAPALADIRPELEAKAMLLADLGFAGTWTIEFVHGLLTDDDHPEALLAQAAADLAVLRELLP